MNETSTEGKYLSPLVSCIECKFESSAKGIFTHFLAKHGSKPFKKDTGKGTTKFLRMCCDIKTKREMSTSTLAQIIKYEKNKKDIIKSCPKCGVDHKKSGLFCSRTCANSHTVSQEQKDKTSATLKKRPKICRPTHEQLHIEKSCEVCGQSFTTLLRKPKKSCSIQCTKILRNAGARKGGQNSAKKNVKRSKDEIKLFELCKSEFQNTTSNDTSIANGWDADILLHDHKIAILWNGPWHYRETGLSNHSLLQVQNRDRIKIKEFEAVGWEVLVFEDRSYTPETAFIEIKNKVAATGV